MRLAALARAVVRPMVVLVLLAAATAVAVWMNHGYFQSNKVRFLINQNRFDQAGALLNRLESALPDQDFRFFPLRVQLATIQMHYNDAVEMTSRTVDRTDSNSDNQQFYWGAIAAFLSGNDTHATQFARRAIQGKVGRGNPLRSGLMETFATETFELPGHDEKEPQFENLSNVEKGALLGLEGLGVYNKQEYQTANDYFNRALNLGCASARVFYATSVCDAMANDLDAAQMYLDYLGPENPGRIFNQLYDAWQAQSKQVATLLAAPELGINDGRRARAAAWAAVRFLDSRPTANISSATQALEQLHRSYPGDVGISLRLGEAYDILKRPRAAYETYRQIYSRWPSIALSYRIESLTGDHKAGEKARSQMISNLPMMQSWNADDIATTGANLIHNDTLAFFSNGDAEVATSATADENITLMLVARGDRAFRLSPSVVVKVNGKYASSFYIAREGWDCYTQQIPLEKGMNHIVVSYTNDSVRLLDSSEDRNFYLKSIFIVRPETKP